VTGPESVQGTLDWHQFRKGKIGASMAPVIMGVSKFKTPLQLWEEIVFDQKTVSNPAMQRGIALEQKALNELNVGCFEGIYRPVVLQSISHPILIASLDGYFETSERAHLVEIKCPGSEDHLSAIEGMIPDHYYPQLQHQMMIAQVPDMIYYSFDGKYGICLVCEHDPKYCEKLMKAELAFAQSIELRQPPSPLDRDWVALEDEQDFQLSSKLWEIEQQIKELEEKKEEYKKQLLTKCFHRRTSIGNLKIQKVIRKGNIDYEKILLDHGIYQVEKYRKPDISSIRFTFS
jgi:putative phage-type endonuclease